MQTVNESWIVEESKSDLKKTEWIKLVNGNNVVRFFGPLLQAKRLQFSQKQFVTVPLHMAVNCPESVKVSYIHFAGAIDRKDGVAKIMQIGPQIMKGIQALVREDDFGHPSRYDINIVKNDKSTSDFYKVTPKAPKPYSASDLLAIEGFDTESLSYWANPSPEHINKTITEFGFADAVSFTA